MTDLERELAQLREAAEAAISDAPDLAALEDVDTRFLGRKQSRLTEILRGIRDLDDAAKRVVGPAANRLRQELEALVAGKRASLERAAEAELLATDRIDLSMPPRIPSRGAPNPLIEVMRRVEDAFIGIGYSIAEGPEVEDDWHNFEALNHPPDHPARSLMDTYYVEGPNGPESALLRTHTSPVQIRVMEAQSPPIYVICPGRVYRRDAADSTHSPVFHQIEGLAIDRGLTFQHLRGTLEVFAEAAFGPGTGVRLVPSFYPFTEPSAAAWAAAIARTDGTGWAAAAWSTPTSSSRSASIPRPTRGSRSGWASRRSP
jgi:phenylalanyl-tRNA synthetase alpha chain